MRTLQTFRLMLQPLQFANAATTPLKIGLGLGAGIVLSVTLSTQAHAGDLSTTDQQALEQTQALLKNPEAVNAATKNDPQAKQANENAKNLMGNDKDTAELYKLSSDIFGNVAKDANGDPAKMQESLNQALKNPSDFAAKLTPEQKAELESLAKKAEARQPSAAAKP